MRMAVIAALVFATLPLAAQSARFGERVEVKLIEIDVVVTDRDGNRVHGLTSSDFEVFEGRKRQEISNFTEYRAAEIEPASTTTPSRPVAAETPEPRTIVILLDSLPRIGLVRRRVYEQLDALLLNVMRQGDRASVLFWEPGLARIRNVIDVTADRDAVRLALAKLGGRVHAASETSPDFGEEEFFEEGKEIAARSGQTFDFEGHMDATRLFGREADLVRFRRKVSGIRRVVNSMAGASGKKVVLYVSQSFAMPPTGPERLTAITFLDDLTDAANGAGVTFYAVRPRVPDEGEEEGGLAELDRQLDALRRLALPTGGLVDSGLPSVEAVGRKIAEDLQSYYSLAYRAPSDGRDRERRISVRTKNPDLRVRARESFIEKSNDTLGRETVIARLFSDDGRNDLDFQLVEGTPKRTGSNRWLLPIRLRIPVAALQFADERNERVARVKVLIVAGNGIAEMTKVNEDELRVVEGKHADAEGFITYAVEVLADSRGSELSVGVYDVRSGGVGVKTLDNRGRFKKNAAAK